MSHISRRSLLKTLGTIAITAPISFWTQVARASGFMNTGAFIKKRTFLQTFSDTFSTNTIGASATNATYVAGGYYHNPSSGSGMVAAATGTPIGNITRGGGLAAAFDGDYTSGNNSVEYMVAWNNQVYSGQSIHSIGKAWPGAKTINRFRVTSQPDRCIAGQLGGYTGTIALKGSNSGYALGGGTTLLSQSLTTVMNTTHDISSGIDTSAPYTFHWIEWFSGAPNNGFSVNEIEFYEISAPPNMTLVSAAYALPGMAKKVTLNLAHYAVNASTMNTDCVVEASRDGTSWSAMTMTSQGAWPTDGTYTLYRGTGTPGGSGNSIKWRIRTLNNKQQRVRAVTLVAQG